MMLPYVFYLKLSCCKDNIHCSTPLAKSTLTFREKKALLEVIQETVEKYTGQNFASNGPEGDSAIVVAQLTISLAFVDV